MKVIKVSSGKSNLSKLLLRQTPNDRGIWNNCKFVVNEDIDSCDCWVVCHKSGLIKKETVLCNPENVIYISMEGIEQVTKEGKKFIEQFSTVVSSDRKIKHDNKVKFNVSTWWVGNKVFSDENGHSFDEKYSLNYDILRNMSPQKKSKLISIIVSTKDFFPEHKSRLRFIDKLMSSSISNYIDFYGHGHNPIPDKWDALIDYKYHIVMENVIDNDMWSEKLGDAFLGFCVPIYYGSPNIEKYFSQSSIVRIDINNFEESLKTIEKLIYKARGYDSFLPFVVESRNKVLNDYNAFNIISNLCRCNNKKKKRVTIHPYESKIKYLFRSLLKKSPFIFNIYKKIRGF